MLQWEHSAILLTFIKLPFVIKICVLSIFEWPLKTGFTVKEKCAALELNVKAHLKLWSAYGMDCCLSVVSFSHFLHLLNHRLD